MTTRYAVLVLTLLSIGFTSCRKQKLKKTIIENSTSTTIPPETWEKTETPPVKVEKYTFEVKNIDFETCKIKSKVSVNSDRFKQSFPANIHIKKDSIIWISITVGLEVARAIITPDTIQILNKLERTYYASNFKQLSQLYNFDLNFKMLQSALLGNMPLEINQADVFSDERSFKKILQARGTLSINNKFDLDNKRLYAIEASDNNTKTNLNINYKNFINENNNSVPTLIELLILNSAKNEKIEFNFEHSKFDFLDRNLRFPFNVPKGFKQSKFPGLD